MNEYNVTEKTAQQRMDEYLNSSIENKQKMHTEFAYNTFSQSWRKPATKDRFINIFSQPHKLENKRVLTMAGTEIGKYEKDGSFYHITIEWPDRLTFIVDEDQEDEMHPVLYSVSTDKGDMVKKATSNYLYAWNSESLTVTYPESIRIRLRAGIKPTPDEDREYQMKVNGCLSSSWSGIPAF